MKLLHDYVAIEPDAIAEKTSSGLYMPEQIKTYPPFGTVRFIGEGITDIKVGDRVVYKVYASVDINTDISSAMPDPTKTLAVLPHSGVIAILDEDAKSD